MHTKSTLDNCVFRYNIIGRRKGITLFPGSPLALMKIKKGGGEPGINSHLSHKVFSGEEFVTTTCFFFVV